MNLKISAVIIAALVAAWGLLAPRTGASGAPTANSMEAARLNNLGCAYMNQQLFEKGQKFFQQALAADPKLTIARLNEGIAEMNLQKVDDARAAFEEVIKQDPKLPTAWYSLGLLAKNGGDSQGAIDAFKRVIEIDSNDADTWYFLGTSYTQAKQFPQAIESFQHAIQINPLHASAEFGLSRAYQQSGDTEHAREHLKRFQYITQNKYGSPMSLAYGEQGQYSRAVESPQAPIKPPPQIKVQFVDVTKEAGITSNFLEKPPSGLAFMDSGACFLDYDGDGLIDLLVLDNGPDSKLVLYHNVGNGKFKDVTKNSGLPSVHAVGCVVGDYDNDGAPDIAITTAGPSYRLILLHNEKNGTFKDVTNATQIKVNVAGTPNFVDYDHDGDLDLYVANAMEQCRYGPPEECEGKGHNLLFRNNADGTFTEVTDAVGLAGLPQSRSSVGTDFNNDRAIDLVVTGLGDAPALLENPREGKFLDRKIWSSKVPGKSVGVAVLDFDHDGWTDLALTHWEAPGLTLWRNNHSKSFDKMRLPETNWVRAFGVAAFDYDNDGWVDLVAVGETKDGKGEVRLFRNLGPDGFKDVTTDVGLDKIHLENPRAIITGDYDNDGATDLLITQNHGPALLLRNVGGNQNHWMRLALKGLNDNKSAIGTKVEIFSGGNRQKYEIYGSNGYLGQNSPYLTVGLGEAKEADVVRMLWPSGVLQDEINVAGDKQQDYLELDRRGSSCPTLFVWNGERYEFVADMLGAGVVGHWVGPGQRDIPRPVEWIKIDRSMIKERETANSGQTSTLCQPERSEEPALSLSKGPMHSQASCTGPSPLKDAAQDDKRQMPTQHDGAPPRAEGRQPTSVLSFRFMEPLEEAVYLDQVRLLAVDHPADVDVYPNEYFASNPPYPPFKVVVSQGARPPAGVWDDHGHDMLPDLQAHRYIGDFEVTHFLGFAKPHSLTLDLGESYEGGPLWLLLHGEVEYFSANSMYAASQAGITAISPYVEALDASGNWKRVVDDMGFPAGGPRTMTADLTGKLPRGTRKIRITTNLQVYWDSILIDRTPQPVAPASGRLSGEPALSLPKGRPALAGETPAVQPPGRRRYEYRLTSVPLVGADLEYHGYPLKIEGTPAGNVHYIYEKASATGPYTRPMGSYTRYGDVLPLLTGTDDKLAVFGSGDEVRLDFDPSKLPSLPAGWVRDYFFAANGYEKDMDFYAAEGNFVAPLPFLSMGDYPYGPPKAFPLDVTHLNYLLEYNTRHMSGDEQRGYWFDYGPEPAKAVSPQEQN